MSQTGSSSFIWLPGSFSEYILRGTDESDVNYDVEGWSEVFCRWLSSGPLQCIAQFFFELIQYRNDHPAGLARF